MPDPADVTLWIALWAGIVSFISPCTLPLYPAYLSYITGMSVQNLQHRQNREIRTKLVLHTVFFLVGISVVFFVLGFSASYFGQFFQQYRLLIQQIGGVLIIIMALFLLGVFKLNWLMRERRFQFTNKPAGYAGSTLVGIGFAAGWTPCIGPILSVILLIIASNPSSGMAYMGAYTLGFAIPFLGLSFFIGSTRWILKYSNTIMKIGAAFMIVMGILLYTDMFFMINNYINSIIQDTWLGRLG
jgi:cytochrome c-type biogenesis protein